MALNNVKKNPFLKRFVREKNNFLRYFKGGNGVLLNTIPKSGTHLLTQILGDFGFRDYQGFQASTPSITMKEQSSEKIARSIGRMLPQELMSGHIFYSSLVEREIADTNLSCIFLYRDPRAIFLSEINYLSNMNRWHRCHKYFERCRNFEEKFLLCLNGLDDEKIYYPSFDMRVSRYLKWVESDVVCPVRFEDLIDDASRREQCGRIAAHLSENFGGDEKIELSNIGSSHSPEASHTYTGMKHNRWKSDLTARQISMLNNRLAQVLEGLGYQY